MKVRRTSAGGYMLQGAARIVSAPSMSKTRAKLESGSNAADWRAIGGDLRRSITDKTKALVG